MSSKRILFSANDPGGAQAIAPVVEVLRTRGDKVIGLATGPALLVFRHAGIEAEDGGSMSETEIRDRVARADPELMLAGTSMGPTIDKVVLPLVPRSLYVLDFWSNYGVRFQDKRGERIVPDAVCVMDEAAKDEMIREGISEERLRLTGNPHFEHFADGIDPNRGRKEEILFISQPVQSNEGETYGFDEYRVLRDLVRCVAGLPGEYALSIRLHPRDLPRKYDEYLGDRAAIAPPADLSDALSAAGLIVGMFSPVLMQAAAAGKPAISYEPGLSIVDPLPSNAWGLTKKATDESQLEQLLQEYAAGAMTGEKFDLSSIWKPGAALRIVDVIDELTA